MESKFKVGDFVTHSYDMFLEEIISKVYSEYLGEWLYVISNNCNVFKESELKGLPGSTQH